MIPPVDLRRLHVLRMVEVHGTVTAAAAALHLTPSAVSHQIRQLSQHMGMALVEPDGRGIRLTAAGQRLVGHADELLAGWERATADLHDLAEGEVGHLRLCGTGTAVAALLAPAAARLRDIAPGVQVSVTEVHADDSPEQLMRGRVDIAVTSPSGDDQPPRETRQHREALFSEPFDLLVPVGHRLTRSSSVRLRAAAEEPWVLAAPGTWDSRHLLTAACATAGFDPHVAHEASSPLAVTALVSAGLGVSLVPRLVPLPAHHAVRRLALTGNPRPHRHVVASTLRGREADPLVARGLGVLHEMAETLPPPLITSAHAGSAEEGHRSPHRHAG